MSEDARARWYALARETREAMALPTDPAPHGAAYELAGAVLTLTADAAAHDRETGRLRRVIRKLRTENSELRDVALVLQRVIPYLDTARMRAEAIPVDDVLRLAGDNPL